MRRRDFLNMCAAAAAGSIVPAGCIIGANDDAAAQITSPALKKPGSNPVNYQVKRLSEHDILQTYTRLLEDAYQYAARNWRTSSFDRSIGYWGDGISNGNQGIRGIASMLSVCGALLKYDDGLRADERQDMLDKATAALRYVTATHFTGTQKCTDGKQWGGTDRPGSAGWQSSMWTGSFAFGAWLVWDHLDSALRQDIHRVVASQNDLLAKGDPPTGLWGDTKAEENGWNVPNMVLGEIMFPSNPHAAAWHEKAEQYMMNTLCTEADLLDTTVVDGRAVNQWVRGANLQPDFTLENHGRFHPGYVACSCYFLTQAAMYYTYAGRPIPQAASHHLMDTWRMFQTILLPWGESACPQGMDWELHGLPFLNLFASLATQHKDPFAARIEQMNLQYMRAWQSTCHGDLTPPGSRLGFTRHAISAEQAAYGFLAHNIFGPATREVSKRAASEQGVWDYRYVGFIAHRTEKKFFSFSWKNKIMGQLIPIGEGHEDNPFFTVPIPNGFVGSFDLLAPGDDKTNKTTVVEHSWQKTPDGFETTGTLLLNGGRLRQELTIRSIGEQTLVYEDRVTALSDVTVVVERGVPVNIESDEISGGIRVVSGQDGSTVYDWQKPGPPFPLSGSWVNVDGRLGVVMVAGSGMTYEQTHGYLAGISVGADVLYGSYCDHSRQFKAGEEVARRVVLFFVEVGPQETSSLAQSCKMEKQSGGQVLRFKQPGGKLAEVNLASRGRSEIEH